MMPNNSSKVIRCPKSPYSNDKTINETVMYGDGTSIVDSILCSFPHDKTSPLASQDFASRRSKNGSQDYTTGVRDSSQENISRISIRRSIKKSSRARKSITHQEAEEM